MIKTQFQTGVVAVVALAFMPAFISQANATEQLSTESVLDNYANIAFEGYSDSLKTAESLLVAVETLLESPSESALMAAQEAWLKSRIPYQQTEVYRFGNAIVDEWEGKVNSWPLDEGLIDYVDASYGAESEVNALYSANVISNPSIAIAGQTIDASHITETLLSDILQEADGNEANVATGYHAIEFLLWGQDLNGTGPGAGARPYTDFDVQHCTQGNCDRRGDYLRAATALLVSDLKDMVAYWEPDGAARKALIADGDAAGLSTILTGMGSLSYGELAGQRIRLGLMLHDTEEEHDCFSDNTHNSHFYDAVGIRNAYLGEYQGINGHTVSGDSLSQLVAAIDSDLDAEMKQRLNNSVDIMQSIVDQANKGEAYDQLIAEGNTAGNALVQSAVDALVAQTQTIERIVTALNLQSIEIEGSDSLDSPNAVFK